MVKGTRLVRVDGCTWEKVRLAMPKLSDKQRSIMLYDYSIIKAEKMLKGIDFKDALGEFLYGKKVWKRK